MLNEQRERELVRVDREDLVAVFKLEANFFQKSASYIE